MGILYMVFIDETEKCNLQNFKIKAMENILNVFAILVCFIHILDSNDVE